MFALEIEFHDGISSPETILIRRNSSVIGSSEQAHVVIEGIASSACELRLVRGIGREFRCQPVRRSGQESTPLPFLEGTYRGTAELKLGEVTVRVTSLDLDLCLASEEVPDKATARVLHRALSEPSPTFPAMVVHGSNPVFLSFRKDEPLLIGRSRKCGLRLDASDVSSEHARVGVDGGKIWVEDLGSTNGTQVDSEKVSGRRFLETGQTIQIGSEFVLSPVLDPQSIPQFGGGRPTEFSVAAAEEQTYPCIVSSSDLIRPNRFPLGISGEITMGRDPANDIWINAPHVSRQHITIRWSSAKEMELVDSSSNGTYLWGERLPRDMSLPVPDGLAVLDFCSGVTAAICRNSAEEEEFLQNGGMRGEQSSFKQHEAALSDYRGAQGAGKLKSWEEFSQPSTDDLPKPPSVFERLVQRHGNQAQVEEQIASEDVRGDDFSPEVDLPTEETAAPNLSAGAGTIMFRRLSGVLDEEPEEFLSTAYSAEDHVTSGEAPRGEDEVDELLLPDDYQHEDFQPPSGSHLLKVLLLGLFLVLAAFCFMLVFGFLSDNYFY